MIGKRLFDIVAATLALIALLVPGLFLALIVTIESRGGAFYRQVRVGKNEKQFRLLKFRTMFTGSDQKGLLTVGSADSRVTGTGKFLRKTKMDELPQFINILFGQMSFVGPRPEVPKYTALYNEEQKKVLSVRPGLTDYASLAFIDESDLLAQHSNPEQYYIDVIMPEKLKLNLKYISEMRPSTDLKIILRTLRLISR